MKREVFFQGVGGSHYSKTCYFWDLKVETIQNVRHLGGDVPFFQGVEGSY